MISVQYDGLKIEEVNAWKNEIVGTPATLKQFSDLVKIFIAKDELYTLEVDPRIPPSLTLKTEKMYPLLLSTLRECTSATSALYFEKLTIDPRDNN